MLNGEFKEVVKLTEYKKVNGKFEEVPNGIVKEFRFYKDESWQNFVNEFFGEGQWKITEGCKLIKKYCKTVFCLSRYYEKVEN